MLLYMAKIHNYDTVLDHYVTNKIVNIFSVKVKYISENVVSLQKKCQRAVNV